MVDFKLLLYPEIVRRADFLRRRFKNKANKSISCNLEENDANNVCLCRPCGKYNDVICEDEEPM